jgi:hypothetical protein
VSYASETGTHVLVPGATAPSSGLPGLFSGTGGALGFTGTKPGERVASTTAPVLLPAAFAIETWIYLDVPSDETVRSLVARSNGMHSFNLYVYSSVAWLEVCESGTPMQYYVGAPGITPSKWHHLIAQGAALAQIEIFADGVRYTSIGTTNTAPLSTRDLSVGSADDFGNSVGANGKIAEVALYDHVLTAERVTAHYLAGRAP